MTKPSEWTRAKLHKPSEHAAVEPWAAAGPGWANSGLYIREPLDKGLGLCVYSDQLGPRASALFPVALAAINALSRAVASEGVLGRRP